MFFLTYLAAVAGCDSSADSDDDVRVPAFAAVTPLTALDAQLIIQRAVASIDDPNLHVAVVDRRGAILGVFSNLGPPARDEDNIAVSLARTTAFFSNSQAPLSSRTVQFLSTFHFPATFGNGFVPSVCPQSGVGLCPNTAIAPQQVTTGVKGTARGPLWQINATNRGAEVATLLTNPPTLFNAGQAYPRSLNINGTFPSPGITLLPGAVPLYKNGRLVGGVGCFTRPGPTGDPDILAAEFAAISGASGSGLPGDEDFFLRIDPEGAIFLGGILLPYVKQLSRPPNRLPGLGFPPPPPDPRWLVFVDELGGLSILRNGVVDPFGYLIGPRASVTPVAPVGLTQAEVDLIITQTIQTADKTRAAIRLPLGTAAKIIAVITDVRGLILAHFRMEDTLTDAVDVVPAKARSAVYYSLPGGPAPLDQWPGFPIDPLNGVAVTTTALGFLSQTFYPPGIDGQPAGPLFALALQNQLPAQASLQGNAPPDPGYQNGLIFFPGAVPLYKNGVLVGGLGVSGDGVENNDFIAKGGARGFEAPGPLRIDRFKFRGVRIPFLKFPQNPGGGS